MQTHSSADRSALKKLLLSLRPQLHRHAAYAPHDQATPRGEDVRQTGPHIRLTALLSALMRSHLFG
jgi:DNA-directed RNA polymerase specialized sigma24 family protein